MQVGASELRDLRVNRSRAGSIFGSLRVYLIKGPVSTWGIRRVPRYRIRREVGVCGGSLRSRTVSGNRSYEISLRGNRLGIAYGEGDACEGSMDT